MPSLNDTIKENQEIPKTVSVSPYWGPITETSADRHLHEALGVEIEFEPEVEKWWFELKEWLDNQTW